MILAIIFAAVAPLYFRQPIPNNCALLEKRLDQDEKDLSQAQQDVGELKQQMQIVLRRGSLPD